MANIVLESKKARSGKDGVIIDENGYYFTTFGALNTYNANGIFYKVEDINKLTGPDSIVGGRLDKGILRTEVGHPNFNGLSGNMLLNKIIRIDLNNVCGHIKSVEFKDTGRSEPGWDGYNIYLVQGWVKPTGPKADILKSALENPDENAVFSVRSAVIEKRVGATIVRNVLEISTWDYVDDPGVPISSQWNAAGIEHKEPVAEVDGSICLSGSCIPKLKELVQSGNEDNDIEKVLESLEREENKNKPWVYNW